MRPPSSFPSRAAHFSAARSSRAAQRSPARPARVRRPPSDTLGPLTVTLSLPVPRALIHDRPHLAASSSAPPCTLHRDLAHLSAPSPSLTRTPAPAPCVADRHGPPVRPFVPAVTPARSRFSTSPAAAVDQFFEQLLAADHLRALLTLCTCSQEHHEPTRGIQTLGGPLHRPPP